MSRTEPRPVCDYCKCDIHSGDKVVVARNATICIFTNQNEEVSIVLLTEDKTVANRKLFHQICDWMKNKENET